MAQIERITLGMNGVENEELEVYSGLRIDIRATSSSSSDYENRLSEEFAIFNMGRLITDGTCS